MSSGVHHMSTYGGGPVAFMAKARNPSGKHSLHILNIHCSILRPIRGLIRGFGGAIVKASAFHLRDRGFESRFGLATLT